MNTTKIYRYEIQYDANSTIGAYGGRYAPMKDKDAYLSILTKMTQAHANEEHPPIWRDLDGFVSGEHFCACPTLESLKTWFKGFNKSLLSVGYKLVEVEVKRVYNTESGLQVGYKLEDVVGIKVLKKGVNNLAVSK